MRKKHFVKTAFAVVVMAASNLALADSFADLSGGTISGNGHFVSPYRVVLNAFADGGPYESSFTQALVGVKSFEYEFHPTNVTNNQANAWVYVGGGNSRFLTVNGAPVENGSFTFSKPFTGDFRITVGSSAGNGNIGSAQLIFSNVAAVPEPEEWAMMLMGFGLVGYQIKRKQRNLLTEMG